jgi:hypothetical protein
MLTEGTEIVTHGEKRTEREILVVDVVAVIRVVMIVRHHLSLCVPWQCRRVRSKVTDGARD